MGVSLEAIFGLMALATAGVWVYLAARLGEGRPILPRETPYPAPWGASDAGLILLVFIALSVVFQLGAIAWVGDGGVPPVAAGADNVHALVRVVRGAQPAIIVLAGLMAVVAAPLCEEFLFRVVLQGGLEATLMRRRVSWLRRLVPVVPILVPAIVFAAMHYRGGVEEEYAWQYYAAMLAATAVAGLVTIALGVAWLRLVYRVTLSDLGLVPKRFARDALLGVVSVLAILVPVYAMQFCLTQTLRQLEQAWGQPMPAPDPVAILVFALVWGYLYYRTRRIVPSLVAHMTLNAVGLLLALGFGG